jgi:Ser/Thr protein kinase RdoA (MazF antagonist)
MLREWKYILNQTGERLPFTFLVVIDQVAINKRKMVIKKLLDVIIASMDEINIFKQRINFSGDLRTLFSIVMHDYNLGELLTYEVITIGYEDLNIFTKTSKGSFLVKIFGSFRDYENCMRYVDIMRKVVAHGIAHPKLYFCKDNYLYQYKKGADAVNLCVMDFIDGHSFYDLNLRPSHSQAMTLIREAGKINTSNIQTEDYYDEWSPVNFINEYKLKNIYLDKTDKQYIEKLLIPFSQINLDILPRVFVHGDIIRPNVLIDKNSNIYIIDFSVASQKPRLQELAVLLCGMFFNEDDPSTFLDYYELLIKSYRPMLNKSEKNILPLFTKACFAMYVMMGKYSEIEKSLVTKENNYWIRLGQVGLKYCDGIWS